MDEVSKKEIFTKAIDRAVEIALSRRNNCDSFLIKYSLDAIFDAQVKIVTKEDFGNLPRGVQLLFYGILHEDGEQFLANFLCPQ